jgi:hypothetical protein
MIKVKGRDYNTDMIKLVDAFFEHIRDDSTYQITYQKTPFLGGENLQCNWAAGTFHTLEYQVLDIIGCDIGQVDDWDYRVELTDYALYLYKNIGQFLYDSWYPFRG